jgi:hypothetical protein
MMPRMMLSDVPTVERFSDRIDASHSSVTSHFRRVAHVNFRLIKQTSQSMTQPRTPLIAISAPRFGALGYSARELHYGNHSAVFTISPAC